MLLEKHEFIQKQINDRLKFWKEYIDHDFSQTVFFMKLYLELEKLREENGENRKKAWNFI